MAFFEVGSFLFSLLLIWKGHSIRGYRGVIWARVEKENMCFKRSLEKKGRSCRSVVEISNERCSDVRFHRRFAAKEREFLSFFRVTVTRICLQFYITRTSNQANPIGQQQLINSMLRDSCRFKSTCYSRRPKLVAHTRLRIPGVLRHYCHCNNKDLGRHSMIWFC